MRDVILYLEEIILQINDIYLYTDEMTFEDFEEDSKTSKAVIRSFEIIGEAVKQIPEGIKNLSNFKNWKQIGAMRDRLIHEYFGVDYSIVWQAIDEDLPQLKEAIDEIINKIR
jgi:uncharacterized protein with HEPN domain